MGEDGKRSALAQERSRQTRRRLIRAALDLWAQRGYPDGIESTTAAEIAETAGVSKATFYLHFSRKEDVLAEIPAATANFIDHVATSLLAKDEPTTRVLDRLHTELAQRVEGADPAAVALSMIEIRRKAILERTNSKREGLTHTYARALLHGKARRDLPKTLDVDETAGLLQAVVADAIEDWAIAALDGEVMGLRSALIRRSSMILEACSSEQQGSAGASGGPGVRIQ